jgi:hypothetical protein
VASLFKPDVPQQDPAVAQQQEQERKRADAANLRETQDQLRTDTLLRSRRSGVRSLLGSFSSGTSTLGSG